MILSETNALFRFNPIQTETKPTITRCLHAKSGSISSANTFATTTTTIRYYKIGSHEASVATEFKGEHIENLCTPLSHDSQSLSVKSQRPLGNYQKLSRSQQCLTVSGHLFAHFLFWSSSPALQLLRPSEKQRGLLWLEWLAVTNLWPCATWWKPAGSPSDLIQIQ